MIRVISCSGLSLYHSSIEVPHRGVALVRGPLHVAAMRPCWIREPMQAVAVLDCLPRAGRIGLVVERRGKSISVWFGQIRYLRTDHVYKFSTIRQMVQKLSKVFEYNLHGVQRAVCTL